MRSKFILLSVAASCLSYAAISLAANVDYYMPNGELTKAEVRGNHFILIGLNGAGTPAPDGTYKSVDGLIVVVKQGIIVQGGKTNLRLNPGAAKGFNPQPDPPGKPVSPGAAKGFNPQPDPPGKEIIGEK
jgi:hypothetical protein